MLRLLYTSLLLSALILIPANSTAQDTALSPDYPDGFLDEIDYIDLEALGASCYCMGVEYVHSTGLLWVTDAGSQAGDTNRIHLITLDHVLVSTFKQNDTEGWGLHDLCWDGTFMYGSDGNDIDYYWPNGVKYGSFSCYAVNPCRAMGWDGIYLYTGNLSNIVYQVTWDGVSGSTATYTAWSTAIDNNGVSGVIYDDYNDCFWVSTASADGKMYKLETDGSLIASYTYATSSANGLADGACKDAPLMPYRALWVVDPGPPCALIAYQLEPLHPAFERQTWGAIKILF